MLLHAGRAAQVDRFRVDLVFNRQLTQAVECLLHLVHHRVGGVATGKEICPAARVVGRG